MSESRKDNEQQAKKGVLEGYQKVGSTFVPPFVHRLGPLGFISWYRQTMPELVWWDVLIDRVSLRFAAQLAEQLALYFKTSDDHSHWWAFISDYAGLSPEGIEQLRTHLTKVNVLNMLLEGLCPFLELYPECPLSQLSDGPRVGTCSDEYLARFEKRLDVLQDKRSRNGVLVQAQVVYMAFVLGRLRVKKGLALADFPEVERYPETDRSQEVGASVCAAVNMLAGESLPKYTEDVWVQYFWRRNLELRPLNLDHLTRR